MQWEFKVNKNQKYLEVITSGVADNDSSLLMAKAISGKMRKLKISKVLIDHRNLEAVEGKTFEVYERPKILRILGLLLNIRIAEVINPRHYEHFSFLETVTTNQGFKFSVFLETGKALEWLCIKQD